MSYGISRLEKKRLLMINELDEKKIKFLRKLALRRQHVPVIALANVCSFYLNKIIQKLIVK